MKAQKNNPNTALKVAIVRSRFKTSRKVAQRTRIPEVRLSKIVTGREQAADGEKDVLAKVLECDRAELFPSETEAVS